MTKTAELPNSEALSDFAQNLIVSDLPGLIAETHQKYHRLIPWIPKMIDATASEYDSQEWVDIVMPWEIKINYVSSLTHRHFVVNAAQDLNELIFRGDKSGVMATSDGDESLVRDEFLSLVDGLIKRTSWPDEIGIRVEKVEATEFDDALAAKVFMRIAFIDGADGVG